MIISTHDVELAYRWADQVLLMEDSRLLHQGPPAEIFANLELVRKARMKLPAVMEIYQEIKARGILDGDRPPGNVLELIDLLDTRNNGSISQESPGKIYLYNVDQVDPVRIRSFLDSGSVKYVGAMETSAKMMAVRKKIGLDFTYGVINKNILKAITGKSSLIMTSGGMIEHALCRTETYGIECNVKIRAIVLDNSGNDSSMNKSLLTILHYYSQLNFGS